jgi:hypothetical protein
MLSIVVLSIITQSAIYFNLYNAECHCAKFRHVERHYAECHCGKCHLAESRYAECSKARCLYAEYRSAMLLC